MNGRIVQTEILKPASFKEIRGFLKYIDESVVEEHRVDYIDLLYKSARLIISRCSRKALNLKLYMLTEELNESDHTSSSSAAIQFINKACRQVRKEGRIFSYLFHHSISALTLHLHCH